MVGYPGLEPGDVSALKAPALPISPVAHKTKPSDFILRAVKLKLENQSLVVPPLR